MIQANHEHHRAALWFMLLPLLWYVGFLYVSPQWEHFHWYVFGGAIVSAAFLIWWLKKWKGIFEIHKFLLHVIRKGDKRIWHNFRGIVVPRDPENRERITEDRLDLPWAYRIRRSFKIRTKNHLLINVEINRAWASSTIKEGNWVSVWGYWRNGYYHGFWVHRTPRMNAHFVRFVITFQSGLFLLITLIHVYFLLHAAVRMNLLVTDYANIVTLIICVGTFVWLVTAICMLLSVLMSLTRKKYRLIKPKRKHLADSQ